MTQSSTGASRSVYTVAEAGRKLGLSKNASYEAVRNGQIPSIRIGKRILVPKIPLDKMLGE
jgi:excisionase family DNA binding protein